MNYTDFQALPVVSAGTMVADITALSPGDDFLFESQVWQKGNFTRAERGKGTELRHKVHFQKRIADMEYPQGVVKQFIPQYAVLESDYAGSESKTPTRKALDNSPADAQSNSSAESNAGAFRDDNNRNRGVLTDPDWS